MALAFSRVSKASIGSQYQIITDVTLDGSYASGGYAITPAKLGHRNSITHVHDAITSTGFLARWVPSTQKLMIYKTPTSGALTECASSDLSSSATIRLVSQGK
jgi:hypothetical protein